MADTPHIPTLLDTIYDLGERMREALDRDDMDAFFELVASRDDLVKQLDACERPPDAAVRWKDRGAVLMHQNRHLLTSIAHHSERLASAMDTLGQVKTAGRRYMSRPAAPQQSHVLNRHLRG